MRKQPNSERHLLRRDFGQHLSFQWPLDSFPICLPPPTFCSAVFKHGVEMIHAYQSKSFRLPTNNRAIRAPCSANGAISNHHHLSSNAVTHLMMIANYFDWV